MSAHSALPAQFRGISLCSQAFLLWAFFLLLVPEDLEISLRPLPSQKHLTCYWRRQWFLQSCRLFPSHSLQRSQLDEMQTGDKDQSQQWKVGLKAVLRCAVGTFGRMLPVGMRVCMCDTPRAPEKRPMRGLGQSLLLLLAPTTLVLFHPTDETLLYVLFTSCLDYHNCLRAGPTCLSSPMGSKCC